MNKNTIIRSAEIVSPINTNKLNKIREFMVGYNLCVNYFIHRLWSENKMAGKYLDKDYIDKARNRFKLTARLCQCAGKQAFEIVKSQHQKSKRQQRMPRLKQLTATLDGRFWVIGDNKNSFEWIKFQSGRHFTIPFNKSKMYNKWADKGFKLTNSIRLKIKGKRLFIDFIFEKDKPQLKSEGTIEGVDLGYVDLLHCSNGQVIGKEFNEIIKQFDIREKHTHQQIKNRMFMELKQLELDKIKMLAIERLRSVKSGTRGMFSRKHNRRLSHWLYAEATKWLEQHCEEQGIVLNHVSPWKTSQWCRFCNNWDRRNRKGKVFKCIHCGHTEDSDSNASQNIQLLGLAGVYSLRSLKSGFKAGESNACL